MTETAVPRIKPDVSTAGSVDLSRVHFVGIGGAGMLPVARVCIERGFAVSGSDARPSEGLKELARLDVAVRTGHASGHVPSDATAVVFTHAVGEDNPEILEARQRGIPVVHRSTALNSLMAAARASIAVMGTHGKSSTSGMLAFTPARMEQNPSFVVGADLDVPGSGGRSGKRGFFVAEVALPRRARLFRRAPQRRDDPAAIPAAIQRLGEHLELRDLPGRPRRIRRRHPAQRPTRRQSRRSPRLRLRPLPQRPHRLVPTPDELTARTTQASVSARPAGTTAATL
ncbi:Mur ligase domain-containing protein [Streptomyces sp. NBC_00445]|uniref:Mur ligase domain-containing protein n=1 Tax=Streptomyces sp. NBC_00445 TaxID=2975745 RepID=UPI002E1EF2D3